MNSMASEMYHFRQKKKSELVTRVKNTEPTLKEKFVEALVASGASVTNFVLIDAQKGDLEVAPSGIYEVDQRGKITRTV